MKRFSYLLMVLIVVLLSSCTHKESDTTEDSLSKDRFLGTWVCEVYNSDDEKLTDLIYEIKENNGSYYGVIHKYDDFEGVEIDDLFITENEIFFINNNKVIRRNEYFFHNDKLILENNIFIKK